VEDLDHFAISPIGLYPNRIVLRVLAYKAKVGFPGRRFRLQAVTPCGEPVAEDPLLSLEDVPEDELAEFVEASIQDGWTFFPVIRALL
jgi:hypothetical protein